MMNKEQLAIFDQELFLQIENESERQENHLELIASENYASPAVLAAQGSILTNKYAEGYPGKRYYGGCEFVDQIESLAIQRVKQLFGAEYANVQPHSGSQANAGVYMALIKPGDTILGLNLAHGGHLTHGSKVSFSGKIYNAVHYNLDPSTGMLDYDEILGLALKHQPKLIIAGFSAYSRVIDWSKFRKAADAVGAYLHVDMAHVAGLIAASEYPSPVGLADVVSSTTHKTLRGPRGGFILAKENLASKINSAIFPGLQGGPLMHVIAAKAVCFKEALSSEFKKYQHQVIKNARAMAQVMINRGYTIISGGTDTHLFLVNLIDRNISGKLAEERLGAANITVNKNSVPDDPRSPVETSGIRLGSPAITTRGFQEKEAKIVANWVCDILDNLEQPELVLKVKKEVLELCREFPVYSK